MSNVRSIEKLRKVVLAYRRGCELRPHLDRSRDPSGRSDPSYWSVKRKPSKYLDLSSPSRIQVGGSWITSTTWISLQLPGRRTWEKYRPREAANTSFLS